MKPSSQFNLTIDNIYDQIWLNIYDLTAANVTRGVLIRGSRALKFDIGPFAILKFYSSDVGLQGVAIAMWIYLISLKPSSQ